MLLLNYLAPDLLDTSRDKNRGDWRAEGWHHLTMPPHDPHFHDCIHVIAGKPCGGRQHPCKRHARAERLQMHKVRAVHIGGWTAALVDATQASRGRMTGAGGFRTLLI
jgi:hypothetical protein